MASTHPEKEKPIKNKTKYPMLILRQNIKNHVPHRVFTSIIKYTLQFITKCTDVEIIVISGTSSLILYRKKDKCTY